MNKLPWTALLTLLCSATCFAQLGTCTGSASLEDFRLIVEPPRGSQPIPLARINELHAGEKLKYQPIDLDSREKAKAMIGLILVPAAAKTPADPVVLQARSAAKPAEWTLPVDVSVVGVVFGPQGLDVKKVHTLLDKKHQVITQLADYAEQTAQVGALVETLSTWEKSPSSPRSLDAVLSGFSSRYGVALPKLNADARPDDQAMTLLRAILPSLSSYDPLSSEPAARMQQSAGLAATMASLFFGSPVTLAVGGTALFQNLRMLMFPDTDFRSAFAQFKKDDQMSLCAKPQQAKTHTRLAYLWALRVPSCGPPAFALPTDLHLPLGWKSTVKASATDPAQLKLFPRVQGWQLVSTDGKEIHPITVTTNSDVLQFDLSKASPPPGAYRLEGKWDWRTFGVDGTVHLHRFGDLAAAKIDPVSEDRLVEGSGLAAIQLEGADFQFVDKVFLLQADKPNAPLAELPFTLVNRNDAGSRDRMEMQVDTKICRRGAYLLRIVQSNGKSRDLPLTIHPPNPVIDGLPLHANLGEPKQAIVLRGSGLERIEAISGSGMEWTLAPASPAATAAGLEKRGAALVLSKANKGDRLEICVTVQGLHQGLRFPDAVEVVPPRPRILGVVRAFSGQTSVELREGEIPAGLPMSFALKTVDIGSTPVVELSCEPSVGSKPAVTLQPGETREGARLDLAGEGALFLSLDPGILGPTGCNLTVLVRTEASGSSDPFDLGRVVRAPQIEKFELTDQKLDNSLYVGILTGKDLQAIEKTGWDPQHGYPVLGIPVPVLGRLGEQTLKVALPWPSPAPHAPIYVWLRGEVEGRVSQARF